MNGKIQHSIIIGIAIIIGFLLHAAISKIPEVLKIQRGYEKQIRMMEITPKEFEIGSTTLLYIPRISYKGLAIDVDYKFYRYQDDSLVQISVKSQ